MEKINKVEPYLKILGYTEEEIDKIILNEAYLDNVYKILIDYENSIASLSNDIDPIKNMEKSVNRKK